MIDHDDDARVGAFCFRRQPRPDASMRQSDASPIRLPDKVTEALGMLIPLLGCGEEAAALAFDGLADGSADPVAAHALATIADEERVHDRLLSDLVARLPRSDRSAALTRAARRFHINLGRGNAAVHLGRIAAVDAAVCNVLARLRRPGGGISMDPDVAAVFARIHSDEARHVRVSRTLAMAGMRRAELRDNAAAARVALAGVMGLAGECFDILGVDPGPMLADVARLPDGLFNT